MGKLFKDTAYKNLDDFIFGSAKYPVTTKSGLEIGGGIVYPEVNFSLPTMTISEESWPEVVRIYHEIATGISERCNELYHPGFVAEIEILPEMTWVPKWGAEITKVVKDVLRDNDTNHGTKTAVRTTVIDLREGPNVKHMWSGKEWDLVLDTFKRSAEAGADLLSIESVGGKDIHDEGCMYCDIEKTIFGLWLGSKDMSRLWSEIVKIANDSGSIPAGDTACGFANTSLVLADKNMIPRVFAAADRVVASVRTLVAVEEGAKGPSKDCGYENIYLKAISGTPITNEGRVAAVAHLSPLGNIASCVCDLWSNESIQHIKLMGGFSEVVSFEQLAYDCRIMNGALRKDIKLARAIRDLNADSDSRLDPMAYILRPDVALAISQELVKQDTHYLRMKKGAELALQAIQKGYDNNELLLIDREVGYIDLLLDTLSGMPDTDDAFLAKMADSCGDLFQPKKFDL
ncbi:MAG: hypothetical protein LBS98_00795 [Coriobacteriales bacterium]|jgi:methanol--5-hydroxybenzimidazolylcobamide Co-methyltransferase|nr:hypothetical protein [Coriobacteriales bacterium]